MMCRPYVRPGTLGVVKASVSSVGAEDKRPAEIGAGTVTATCERIKADL